MDFSFYGDSSLNNDTYINNPKQSSSIFNIIFNYIKNKLDDSIDLFQR